MFVTCHSFAAPTCIPNLPNKSVCVRHQDYNSLTLLHCAPCISLSSSKRSQQTPHTYAAQQVAGKGRTLVVVSSSSSWVLSHGVRAVRAPQTGLKPVAKVKGKGDCDEGKHLERIKTCNSCMHMSQYHIVICHIIYIYIFICHILYITVYCTSHPRVFVVVVCFINFQTSIPF